MQSCARGDQSTILDDVLQDGRVAIEGAWQPAQSDRSAADVANIHHFGRIRLLLEHQIHAPLASSVGISGQTDEQSRIGTPQTCHVEFALEVRLLLLLMGPRADATAARVHVPSGQLLRLMLMLVLRLLLLMVVSDGSFAGQNCVRVDELVVFEPIDCQRQIARRLTQNSQLLLACCVQRIRCGSLLEANAANHRRAGRTYQCLAGRRV